MARPSLKQQRIEDLRKFCADGAIIRISDAAQILAMDARQQIGKVLDGQVAALGLQKGMSLHLGAAMSRQAETA